jgi:hypothetical protein
MNNISDDKALGYIMMLDISGSMIDALASLKIDAKAFVRCSRLGDQFGVNSFSDTARWVYPKSSSPGDPTVTPTIATVTSLDREPLAAVYEIEGLHTENMTNMGQAIQLSNNMIGQAHTPLKAFVMLSDGGHNSGTDPINVLGDAPPIFIAGLKIIDVWYFNQLIAKNSKSRFYNAPNSLQMMQIFNQILADSNDANLSLDSLDGYAGGSDYLIKPFTISGDDGLSQLNIVWSDKKYRYTPDAPAGNNIHIDLMDPDQQRTDIKPDISDEGYCIYNLQNEKPGEWHAVIEYSIPDTATLSGTCGCIEYEPGAVSTFDFPSAIAGGEHFEGKVNVMHENNPLEHMQVKATISRPLRAVDDVIEEHKNDLERVDMEDTDSATIHARLQQLREDKLKNDGVDILPHKHSLHSFKLDEDGIYKLKSDVPVKGVYNINVEIDGVIPATGRKYKSLKRGSFTVD